MSKNRRFAGILKHAALIVLFAVLMRWLDFKGVFDGAQGPMTALYLWLSPGVSSQPQIVTIAIDDKDYENLFGKVSPLEPSSVKALVSAIQNSIGPSVIGVDLLTADDDYNDGYAAPKLAADPRIVWAASVQAASSTSVSFLSWFFGSHEEPIAIPGKVLGSEAGDKSYQTDVERGKLWGLPLFPHEGDQIVRKFPRAWKNRKRNDALEHNTFAREVAGVWCGSGGNTCAHHGDEDELFVPINPPLSSDAQLTVGGLFDCTLKRGKSGRRVLSKCTCNSLCSTFPKPLIVLLGGTFAEARDTYPTALGSETPGLLLNALAVRAEIAGPDLAELSSLSSFVLELIFGVMTLVFFENFRRRHTLFATTWLTVFSVSGVAVLLSVYLLRSHQRIWVGWVGMILSGLAWDMVRELSGHSDSGSHTRHHKGKAKSETTVYADVAVVAQDIHITNEPPKSD